MPTLLPRLLLFVAGHEEQRQWRQQQPPFSSLMDWRSLNGKNAGGRTNGKGGERASLRASGIPRSRFELANRQSPEIYLDRRATNAPERTPHVSGRFLHELGASEINPASVRPRAPRPRRTLGGRCRVPRRPQRGSRGSRRARNRPRRGSRSGAFNPRRRTARPRSPLPGGQLVFCQKARALHGNRTEGRRWTAVDVAPSRPTDAGESGRSSGPDGRDHLAAGSLPPRSRLSGGRSVPPVRHSPPFWPGPSVRQASVNIGTGERACTAPSRPGSRTPLCRMNSRDKAPVPVAPSAGAAALDRPLFVARIRRLASRPVGSVRSFSVRHSSSPAPSRIAVGPPKVKRSSLPLLMRDSEQCRGRRRFDARRPPTFDGPNAGRLCDRAPRSFDRACPSRLSDSLLSPVYRHDLNDPALQVRANEREETQTSSPPSRSRPELRSRVYNYVPRSLLSDTRSFTPAIARKDVKQFACAAPCLLCPFLEFRSPILTANAAPI